MKQENAGFSKFNGKQNNCIKRAWILLLLIPGMYFGLGAQTVSPRLLSHEWDAKWICVPDEPAQGYGVYLFRKKMDIRSIPQSCIIHVSADNRYKLYINEKQVSVGPARGDLYYWNYETIDIAPFLTEGINIIAARVWNDGEWRPEAQISWRTGFILQTDTNDAYGIQTNTSWKCMRDSSYDRVTVINLPGYYVAGPGEFIDMRKRMTGWNGVGYNDDSWENATTAFWRGGSPKGLSDAFGWMLVSSQIPAMEYKEQRLQTIRETHGINVTTKFPALPETIHIPANTQVTMLLDQGFLTNAYPVLIFSKGRNASITLQYAESLFIPAFSDLYGTNSGGYMGAESISGKGNRNEVHGKLFLGRKDSLISNGMLRQEFTTLYWRTFRYILLSIRTHDDPIEINDLYGIFTGYPFDLKAKFTSDQPDLQKILDIGWRTARLCAMETYMDCPYYEQLQYIGDTRIQAMISYYNTGDDRLARNAINQADHSRIAEGITLSRHPSFSPQIIPTFSLWYIGMLWDYWMYRPDSLFVMEKLAGTRTILEFFHRYQGNDGSLRNVPYWNFCDWVKDTPGWNGGVAPTGKDGTSSIFDMQLLLAYQKAMELEERLGMKALALQYKIEIDRLKKTIRASYWDNAKGLFADTKEKTSFSQHANTLALLTDLLDDAQIVSVAEKLENNTRLTPATIYFKYYHHQALTRAGSENYLKALDIWNQNIKMGLTTWAEDSDIDKARSDCHAWGASPNIEFYRTVLGIDTDGPGFSPVKIEPHLGTLKSASGEIPHPKGTISVQYVYNKGKWNMKITLPNGLTGRFVRNHESYELKSGENQLVF